MLAETKAVATARLEKAGFAVVAYADRLGAQGAREDEATARERALAPFKEHFSQDQLADAERYLRGQTTTVPASLFGKNDYYNRAASVVGDALSGEVERWNPEVSTRLLALWLALREPTDADLSLGLGQTLPPELGVNRAKTVADTLERRGLHPVLATRVGISCEGESRNFLAPLLLQRLDVLDAPQVDREIAREVAQWMVPQFGLGNAPTMRRHYQRLLASGSAALGVDALNKLAEGLASEITREHLAKAAVGCRVGALIELGKKLEKHAPEQHAGATRAVYTVWFAASTPDEVVTALAGLPERDDDLLASELIWDYLVTTLEKDPAGSFAKTRAGFDFGILVGRLSKPKAATKERIAALCADKKDQLGSLSRLLAKYGGTQKLAPMPYAAADLEGLPAPLAKAWAKAREQSWKAGVKLPKGASAEALDAVAQSIGAPLPEDVRSFYQLHDGAGPDECFRSCRLLSIREAVARRKELGEIGGAPFDPAWLPLTDDGAGNHQCVILRGKNAGAIVDFDHESGGGRVLAKSFATFVAGAKWEA